MCQDEESCFKFYIAERAFFFFFFKLEPSPIAFHCVDVYQGMLSWPSKAMQIPLTYIKPAFPLDSDVVRFVFTAPTSRVCKIHESMSVPELARRSDDYLPNQVTFPEDTTISLALDISKANDSDHLVMPPKLYNPYL